MMAMTIDSVMPRKLRPRAKLAFRRAPSMSPALYAVWARTEEKHVTIRTSTMTETMSGVN